LLVAEFYYNIKNLHRPTTAK